MTTQVWSLQRTAPGAPDAGPAAGPVLLGASSDPTASALVTADGTTLSHGELRERVTEVGRHLPDPAEG
ncbi:MAG TPA: hypothetical protein VK045_02160 [Ornithinicoccus sp.]|nr:hypothetical protein [Ornithinicoccus sp.]